jgi:hypothetical protein
MIEKNETPAPAGVLQRRREILGDAAVLPPVAAKSNLEAHPAETAVAPGAGAEKEDADPDSDAENEDAEKEDASPDADAEKEGAEKEDAEKEDAARVADAENKDADPDAGAEEVIPSKFCPRCGEPTLDGQRFFCDACRDFFLGEIEKCEGCAAASQDYPRRCPEHVKKMDLLVRKSLLDAKKERA